MRSDRPSLPHDYPDRQIREGLLLPANLRALLRRAVPELAERFAYDRIEVVRPTFLLDDWRKRESDVLLRSPLLATAGEQQVLVCVLIEHWSNPDHAMPLRVLLYGVLYWEREWRDWEQRHGRECPCV
jgi:hypothetical protein